MHSSPFISIIMPVYNACRINSNYLVEALESAINQTYKNYELIIVDDGSTDQSSKLCQDFIQSYQNMKIQYFYKENGGQSTARNFGAGKAKGCYLFSSGHDDIWKENKLETILPYLDEKTDFIYTDFDSINEAGSTILSEIHRKYLSLYDRPHPKQNIEDILYQDVFVMPGLMTIKKETFFKIKGFDEELSGYEDDDLFLRIFETGNIKYLPVSTLKWRIYENSYSFSNRMVKSRLNYWEKLIKNYTSQGKDRRRVREISSRFFYDFLSQAISQYLKNDKLFYENFKGLKKVLGYIPCVRKWFYQCIFLLDAERAIGTIHWIFTKYEKILYQIRKNLHRQITFRKILVYFLNHTFLHRYLPKSINRERLAGMYIQGNGIEIGALKDPLKIPKSSKVKYVDRMSVADLMKQYPLKEKDLVPVDIIDDGEQLESIDDSSLDFVIANHYLEHCQNPILALKNMFRVLRVNGILFLAIPDMNDTYDRDRIPTPFEHLLRDS